MKATILTALCVILLAMNVSASDQPTIAELEQSLRAAETAFAQTMADRDLDAFASFLAEDAVFSGGANVLRGREEIVKAWARFYEGPDAPFSWKPERAHVIGDGTLGGTTGPVFAPDGKVIGQFVSTWRRQPDGTWKVVIDLAPNCQ